MGKGHPTENMVEIRLKPNCAYPRVRVFHQSGRFNSVSCCHIFIMATITTITHHYHYLITARCDPWAHHQVGKKNEWPYDVAIPVPHSKTMEIVDKIAEWAPMNVKVSFTIAKRWKESGCPSRVDWLKMWQRYMMELNFSGQKGNLCRCHNTETLAGSLFS